MTCSHCPKASPRIRHNNHRATHLKPEATNRSAGKPVSPASTHLQQDASALEVEARERPQPNSGRFLLDVHLGTLARRMRLLGLDAACDPEGDDSSLAARSATEHQELLTRDHGLLFRKTVPGGALIRSDDVDEQLADVLSRFAPRLAPWTRGIVRNSNT